MDTSEYQVSDLDSFEFFRENDQLDVDAVFRPGIDTPFAPTAFDDLEMGGSANNPILLSEKEDKKNFPPQTPVSERLIRPPAMLKSRQLGTKIECVVILFIESCLNKYYWVCGLKQLEITMFHFITTFFKN